MSDYLGGRNKYKEIVEFIRKFRDNIRDEVFTTQEYSIKLIQVPKIGNTGRNDLAVEFVNWNSVSNEDMKKYDKLITIVKDRVIKTEAINPGKLKPGKVISKVNKKSPIKINHADHKHILAIFKVRPYKGFDDNQDPFNTNTKYCHYDEAHNDYLYQDVWVDFLLSNLTSGKLKKNFWQQQFREGKTVDIKKYEQV